MIRGMKKYLYAFLFGLATSNKALAASGCPDEIQNNVAVKGFKSVFSDQCLYSYEGWITATWEWTMVIMIPLSVLILTGAGILYMTSEGDSTRVTLAKKLIIGVVSGVGLLILARLLIVGIIGLDSATYDDYTLNIIKGLPWFV